MFYKQSHWSDCAIQGHLWVNKVVLIIQYEKLKWIFLYI